MFYVSENDELYHYGMPRRSGRYPWGSGEHPFQHEGDFLAYVEQLNKDGLTEKEIADKMGLTIRKLRVQKSLAIHERRQFQIATVKSLKRDGLNNSEIGRKMGLNESTVRSLLNEQSEKNTLAAENTAKQLLDLVDEKGMIDVGVGVERELGISKEKLQEALYICSLQGYPVYSGRMDQVTNDGKKTTQTVLCPPGTEHSEIYNLDKITTVKDYQVQSPDGGYSWNKLRYPASIDSSRIQINYGDQGGNDKDGVIELRRGVEDISLGNSNYAQVRIAVDGTHYLKGMAVYSDDLPPGVDIRFNTNKPSGTPKEKVFKELSDDPINPFGAYIPPKGQSTYFDKDGNEHLRVINKVRAEGEWDAYSDSLSSQFLSKQNKDLIAKQLKLTYANSVDEFNEIKKLTNQTVKKQMLKNFADECDGAAEHLQAAALPRQSWQVILPVPSLKDNEIYAPNYKDGEKVALVRYPHGGTFEIPILTVNNKHPQAKKALGQATDAVGINKSVADRLSGADFDGDTVLVIPTNNKVKITATKALDALKDFDPKAQYGPGTYKEGTIKLMAKKRTGNEMGQVSNLITDMTLQGAPPDEIARAVKHSMVVIDAEKHKLNYKQSEIDNGITSLKRKYQTHVDLEGKIHYGGASTLISRASAEINVPETRGQEQINKGERKDLPIGASYFKESGRVYYQVQDPDSKKWINAYKDDDGTIFYKTGTVKDKNGKTKNTYSKAPDSFKVKEIPATQKSTQMKVVRDANDISSGTIQERYYASYANHMKALANEARKTYLDTPPSKYNKAAKEKYINEVNSLDSKLNIALKNAPREREAQRIANTTSRAKLQSNPDMSKTEYKKIKQKELEYARSLVGARKKRIDITDKEWEAIQAGAISDQKLKDIIANSDSDQIKKLATPRQNYTKLTQTQINRVRAMYNIGYTMSDIAETMGVSVSTIRDHIKV